MLLLGAGYDACTSFHLAEYRIPSPLVEVGRPAAGGGWEVVTEVAISSERFDELGRADRAPNGTVPSFGAPWARRTYVCSPWWTRWRTQNGGSHCTDRVTKRCGAPPTKADGRVPRLGAHAE